MSFMPGYTLGFRSQQQVVDSFRALPGFYAAVIVFAVKARVYFETRGMLSYTPYMSLVLLTKTRDEKTGNYIKAI